MLRERRWAVWKALLGLVAAGACSCAPQMHTAGSLAPSIPTTQAKCMVAAAHDNPLVTEWPASEKANLESRLREGAVVVAYEGCTMRLLPNCRAPGRYGWRRTTPATDVIEIRNTDDLYAKLPLGAVSLEAELARTGRLSVQTTVAGQIELQGFDPAIMPWDAACVGATHVLASLSVGAFKMRSGGSVTARGGAGIPVVGGQVGTSSEEALIREAGVADSCKSSGEGGPHPDCASPVQMFLRPLPTSISRRGAPGTVSVTFLSADSSRTWDVVVGDRVICKTPCDKWLDPVMPYGMKTGGGFLRPDHVVEVPDLRKQSARGPLVIKAHPRSDGELAGGIVMATFGGAAVLTGIVLAAIGCSTEDNEGLCKAGGITLPIGLALTVPSIYLMLDSRSKVEVQSGAPVTSRTIGIGGKF